MKIAIPTRGTIVDDHFGHCESYTIYCISKDGVIADEEHYPAPRNCGCKSNIIHLLKEKGVTIMLAGSMGQGAANKILDAEIKLYRGCSGDVRQLADAFLRDEISDSGQSCLQHHHHHHEGNSSRK